MIRELRVVCSIGSFVIKTILVPTSGSDTDRSVFDTALAVGRTLAAHLCLFHVNLSAGEAALHAHLEFCQGPELADALQGLREHEEARSTQARKHFETFCSTNRIPICETPGRLEEISAHWLQQTDQAAQRLLIQARHHDLVVVGRRRNQDYLPGGLIEEMLLYSGRPILIAPPVSPVSLTGTVVVGWKETPEAARTLAAAVPLLKHAKNVILLGVSEAGAASGQALHDCARQLAWHGIIARASVVGNGSRPAATELTEATTREHADLLVVGGFGHGRLREGIFGGVTQALIEHADFPVFMAH
jgi:nucleotide-binding universal stress UspA family protein